MSIRPLLITFVLGLAGCGSSARLAPVSGKVTLDGQPLANAHIAFQPMAATGTDAGAGGSYAVTDTQGQYTLHTFEGDQPGAAVGKHRVEINPKTESSDAEPRLHSAKPPVIVPAKYNRLSELTFDVPAAGSSAANFDLTSRQP